MPEDRPDNPDDWPDDWHALADSLARNTAAATQGVYVLGPMDAGKSTLCHYLVQRLHGLHGADGARGDADKLGAALLDCDAGQSTLGPPTTLGLATGPLDAPVRAPRLRFVGSTTPVGHLLQTLVAAKRLAELATADTSPTIHWLVIDSPGLIAGDTGREFQHQMIELLAPRRLVVMGEGAALDAVTSVFERRGEPTIHRLAVPAAVTPRTAARRAAYRAQRFQDYFAGATSHELDLTRLGLHGHLPPRSKPDEAARRIVALCDDAGLVVVLAIVEQADWENGRLLVHAPPFEEAAVRSVQFGTLEL